MENPIIGGLVLVTLGGLALAWRDLTLSAALGLKLSRESVFARSYDGGIPTLIAQGLTDASVDPKRRN